jgi:hypothetical protein
VDPIFQRITITSVEAAIPELRQARFPKEQYVSSAEVIALKRDARRNADVLQSLVHHLLPAAAASPGHLAILNQLRRDLFEVRRECGKVSVNFLRPRPRRIVQKLHKAYEEMRLSAILVCQQSEPELIDSLTVAL